MVSGQCNRIYCCQLVIVLAGGSQSSEAQNPFSLLDTGNLRSICVCELYVLLFPVFKNKSKKLKIISWFKNNNNKSIIC